MSERVTFTEDRVPIEGIAESAASLVEMYGGDVTSSDDRQLRFTLPVRRGIRASGSVACEMTWTNDGVVTLSSDAETTASKAPRFILLVIGAAGAIVWLLWPFFPNLGPAAAIGGLIAFAVYFMTLRRTGGGVAYDFLQRLASAQRDRS